MKLYIAYLDIYAVTMSHKRYKDTTKVPSYLVARKTFFNI